MRVSRVACRSPQVFREAARLGDLPLLTRLRGLGCAWDASAWEGGAEGGCGAALAWLAEQGCPRPAPGCTARLLLGARQHGDAATLAALAGLGLAADATGAE
jgi:hypothetical protein